MKIKRKIVSLLTAIAVLSSIAFSVSASQPSNMVTSNFQVNAGGSRFSSVAIQKATTSSTCYMRLRGFKFSAYNAGVMPSGCYIYARLYTDTPSLPQASSLASFSQTTSAGNYNYSYLPGSGGLYEHFVLKTNSSYYGAYEAKIDWSPDEYT